MITNFFKNKISPDSGVIYFPNNNKQQLRTIGEVEININA